MVYKGSVAFSAGRRSGV